MADQFAIDTDDETDRYTAPDVVRLGTAEALTAGNPGSTNLGDGFSSIT